MQDTGYQEVEHTADWALEVRGRDLAELLVNAARGMLALMEVSAQEAPQVEHRIELEADEPESLLVSWLEELLYRIETRSVTCASFDIEALQNMSLRARVVEVPLMSLRKPIKAVTYHNLAIRKTPEGLSATIVFDV